MQSIRKSAAIAPRVLAALILAFPLLAAPGMAAAEDWHRNLPLRGDREMESSERDRLFAALADSANAETAGAIALSIWALWFRAPSAAAREMMDDAMERRQHYDIAGAIEVLDRLVTLAPDWAEAWNQRATLRYMKEDFDGSLADIERVLALEPRHFGALAGEALILMRFGRIEAAQAALKRAVAINPFLAERSMLIEERQPAGKDI